LKVDDVQFYTRKMWLDKEVLKIKLELKAVNFEILLK